jgi:hypothetical protein
MGADLRHALHVIRFKAARNWYWGRTHGWANLVEEHDLDPRVRVPRAARKAAWLARNRPAAGSARPIFLVGAQRSGTNMIAHGLDQAPEVTVYNEGDRRAFRGFQLRELSVVDELVARSRRPFVLFKPLCDSDRTGELLDRDRGGPPARAVWAFRDVEGRVRSHVLKFGDSNLRALQRFVSGEDSTHWQVRALSPESADLVRSLDVERMTPETASALFWYVRNRQFFELGLHERDDVMLADYGAFLSEPREAMRALCSLVGFPYRPELVAHIQPQQRTPRRPVVIDERVRDHCAELTERLTRTYREQRSSMAAASA